MAGNFDRQITIFSPQGHLYQIEYAMKAAAGGGSTAIAVRSGKTSVFISQRKVPVSRLPKYMRIDLASYLNDKRMENAMQDRLVDPTSLTSIYKITDTVGCLLIGLSRKIHIYH